MSDIVSVKDRLKKYWNRMQFAGIDITAENNSFRPSLVLNQICASGVLLMIFYIALSIYLIRMELLVLTLFGICCFSITIYLNSLRKYLAAKYFFMSMIFFAIIFTTIFTGIEGKGQYGLLGTAIIPLVIFNERRTIISLFLLNVVMFFVVSVLCNDVSPYMELDEDFYIIAYYISFTSIAIIIFLITFYFKRNNETYELAILEQKKIIAHKNREVTDSIEYAKNIQRSILTSENDLDKIFESYFVLYQPKDIVSGDFYRAYRIDDEQILWLVADCTGHGVPGALMSMIGNAILNEIILQKKIIMPNEILDQLRTGIISTFGQTDGSSRQRDGMDISVCLLNTKTGLLKFSSANNPLWIIGDREGQLTLIETSPDKQPVGIHHGDMKPFTLKERQVQQGDKIYLFTDGFADQFGGETYSSGGKKYKYSRMKELFKSLHHNTPPEQKNSCIRVFDNWKGILEQVDDVCIFCVHIPE
jgi:serine phosphatase RsbU (regulator of sigma subunit)